MIVQVPRRGLHKVDGLWCSFASLDQAMPWPKTLVAELEATLCNPQPTHPLTQLLLDQGVLRQGEDHGDTFFPLAQVSPNAWCNSSKGQRYLQQPIVRPTVVLDSLCWEEIQGLPPEASLLYLGDRGGGFWASRSPDMEGNLPCPTCLMRRYLAGREGSASLYRALRQGATIAFEQKLPEFDHRQPGLWYWDRQGLHQVEDVLPLPECRLCLERSTVRDLNVSLFAPVVRVASLGSDHLARLGQMLWICDTETVGHGGARDPDPVLGRQRAVNEALERYSAHVLPAQSEGHRLVFESPEGARMFSLGQALLREPGSLSTGLACRDSLEAAIEDGLLEVCERDALARFWLDVDQERARVVLLQTEQLEGMPSQLWQIDSYHQPTVLCLARTEQGAVLGSACGAEAGPKAIAECLQNAMFLSHHKELDLAGLPESFEAHMLAYWTGRYLFPDLGRWAVSRLTPQPLPSPVCHRELTPPDLQPLGVHAVRVLVPGLLRVPMSHHDWPAILGPGRKPPSQPHPFG